MPNQLPGQELSYRIKQAQEEVKKNQKKRQQERRDHYEFLAGPTTQKRKSQIQRRFKV